MATRVLVSGHWHHDQQDGRTRVHMWHVGQQVTVQPRTWPGYVPLPFSSWRRVAFDRPSFLSDLERGFVVKFLPRMI
jgi:hypothetical protein